MLEYREKHFSDGTSIINLVSDELPKSYNGEQFSYSIRQRADGWCECVSRSNGPGSTRYHAFDTLDKAFAHGMKWARRKIAEDRREWKKQITPLQKEMLIRIAEEHDFAPERSNNFADYSGCPVVDAILNKQDKGTVTSLINANMVKHYSDEINFVSLTRKGFEAYLSIRN